MLVLVLVSITLCPLKFCNHLVDDDERNGCFVFSMFCYCKCPVALPQSSVGWSAVCGCGIF